MAGIDHLIYRVEIMWGDGLELDLGACSHVDSIIHSFIDYMCGAYWVWCSCPYGMVGVQMNRGIYEYDKNIKKVLESHLQLMKLAV